MARSKGQKYGTSGTEHMTRLTPFIAAFFLALAAALPAAAQNPFAPRMIVNDRVITNFEVQQRALFLELFNTPGDLQAEALNRLVDERLQLIAAERLGLRPTPEQIAEGMAEFASRVDLSTDEFLNAIGQAGVAEESFVDFVTAGVAWREVVRRRFGGRVNVSDADIDRAMSLTSQRGAVRVLLSEIVLPNTPEFAAESRELAGQIARITGFDAFADAARRFSVAESGQRGGQIDWVPLENLPEPIQPILLQLQPGQVSPPIPLQNALILFQLRSIDRRTEFAPNAISVEYARALIPGAGTPAAETEIARLRARADTCIALESLTSGLPEDRFQIIEQRLSDVPTDVAFELARLDEREFSSNLRQGDSTVLLMLCSRMPASDLRPGRDEVADRVLDQRISIMANGYLQELRADAHIRTP